MKRIIACILILCAVSLVACGEMPKDSTDSTDTVNESEMPDTDISWEDYQIVIPAEASREIKSAARKLQTSVKDNIGVHLYIVADNSDGLEKQTEILVGNTSRLSHATLKYLDYSITKVSDRAVINGGSDEAIAFAVDWYIDNCVKSRDILPYEDYTYNAEYPLENMTLGTLKLSEYTVNFTDVGDISTVVSFTEKLSQLTGVRAELQKGTASERSIVLTHGTLTDITMSGNTVNLCAGLGEEMNYVTDMFVTYLLNAEGDTVKMLNVPYYKNYFDKAEPHKLTYLENTYTKLMRGESINISYMGGSVTDGYGSTNQSTKSWRANITSWLADTYGVRVNANKASIGGTGSYFGAFRYDTDIAAKQVPDLLFIEFAINDRYKKSTYDEVVRQSETLVLKAYEQNPNVDIIYVLTFDNITYASDYEQLRAHRDVAEHYGLLCIKLGDLFFSHIEAENRAREDYFADGVHPNDNGYALYTEFIKSAILYDFPEGEVKDTQISAHILPESLAEAPMTNAHMITSQYMDLSNSSGWSYQAQNFASKGMQFGGRVYSEASGSKFTFKFVGTDIGLLCGVGSNRGRISVSIDGGEAIIIDTYDRSQDAMPFVIASMLNEGEHTVTVELLDNANSASTGIGVEIGALLIN